MKSIKISTLSCRDPIIKNGKTFLDMIKMASGFCNVTIFIGEDPINIENDYPEVAVKLKELITDYNVFIYYHGSIHAKHILVDDVDEKVIYVSTSNFSYRGLEGNYEVGILLIINDDVNYEIYDRMVQRYNKIFRQFQPKLVVVDQQTNMLDKV